MNIPIDIHAHRLPQVPGAAIVNAFPETFSPQGGEWYSVGIHPCRIASSAMHRVPGIASAVPQDAAVVSFAAGDVRCLCSLLSRLVRHPQVLAVGEAGLDKRADAPMGLQVEVFGCQARLAEEAGKPLVIHLVKAADELLKVKRDVRPSSPWIIHGFRGKAALAEEYLRHGFYLSFGEKYQEAALRRVPADRLFIETDESGISVGELYARVAEVRGVSLGELAETVRRNVRELFFKP